MHLTLALVLLAILGAGAIPMTFLLGRRFGGPVAGLVAAGAIAVYPALLEYQGLLLTEPLAAFLLSAGLVAFFAAAERERGPRGPLGLARVRGPLRPARPRSPGVPAARPRAAPGLAGAGGVARAGPTRRCTRRPLAAGHGARPRPVDDPQRGRVGSLRADLDRRRQGALHRHQPRGRRRRRPAARRPARRTAGPARQTGSRRPGRRSRPAGPRAPARAGRGAELSGPGNRRGAGQAGKAEPGGRGDRGAAALRRDDGPQVIRHLDRRRAGRDARPALADPAARDRHPRPRRRRGPSPAPPPLRGACRRPRPPLHDRGRRPPDRLAPARAGRPPLLAALAGACVAEAVRLSRPGTSP